MPPGGDGLLFPRFCAPSFRVLRRRRFLLQILPAVFRLLSGVARIFPGEGPNFFRAGSTLGILDENCTPVPEP